MKDCDIVQDLLISYFDGTLKEGSKDFVEKHLEKCEKCKEVLKEIKEDVINENEEIEIDYLKKMRKRNIIKNIILIILGIIFLLFITISIVSFKNYFKELKIELFLEDNIAESKIEDIKEQIKEIDEKVQIQYVSSNDALDNMKEKLGEESENLLKGFENKNVFPESLIITGKLTNLKKVENLAPNMEGIKKVYSNINSNPYVIFIYNVINKIK